MPNDYSTVNSPEFVKAIRQIGPGSDMLNQDFNRVKRRFDPTAPKGGGTASLSTSQMTFIFNWTKIYWDAKDAAGHWGHLHFVCLNGAGGYDSWPIEKLRDVEREGTSSVWVDDWAYPDGTLYPDVWAVMIDGKIDSPHENRDKSRPSYLPLADSLCAFWVGTWEGAQNPHRRTDLLPFRYEPLGAAPRPEPPPPTPTPGEPVDRPPVTSPGTLTPVTVYVDLADLVDRLEKEKQG